MRQFRQGDLLFEEVNEMPQGKGNSSPILAYGEVTGHSHTLVGDFERIDVEIDGVETIYFNPGDDCAAEHEEHNKIPFSKNRPIRVTRQREYNPLLNISQKVAD